MSAVSVDGEVRVPPERSVFAFMCPEVYGVVMVATSGLSLRPQDALRRQGHLVLSGIRHGEGDDDGQSQQQSG
jgi:hypothetical protein